jgi:ubiquinone/menaquinone biosynthesis C-methylase UbiE
MKAVWTVEGDETSWTAWAESRTDTPASSLVRELIATRIAGPQEWAVDIGCGTGRAFIPLAEAGYRVIGIDPTPKCIELSLRRALQSGIIAYPIQASAAQLPLRAASAAFVFAFGTLFHLSLVEVTLALHEIRRVLRPEGEALLHFLDIEDWRRSLGKEVDPDQVPVPSFRAVVTCFCPRQVIEEWLEEAGLNLLSLELRTSESEAGQQRNWLAQCRKSDGHS